MSFLPVLVFVELLVVELVALLFLSVLYPLRARRDRRRLRTLADDRAELVRRRNEVIHDVIAIRRAAEREMQRIVGGDVIEGNAWEE